VLHGPVTLARDILRISAGITYPNGQGRKCGEVLVWKHCFVLAGKAGFF
jgi:hypothetical protein